MLWFRFILSWHFFILILQLAMQFSRSLFGSFEGTSVYSSQLAVCLVSVWIFTVLQWGEGRHTALYTGSDTFGISQRVCFCPSLLFAGLAAGLDSRGSFKLSTDRRHVRLNTLKWCWLPSVGQVISYNKQVIPFRTTSSTVSTQQITQALQAHTSSWFEIHTYFGTISLISSHVLKLCNLTRQSPNIKVLILQATSHVSPLSTVALPTNLSPSESGAGRNTIWRIFGFPRTQE